MGFFAGFAIQNYFINDSTQTTSKTIFALVTALGLGLIFLIVGEYIGIKIKHSLKSRQSLKVDRYLGSLFSLIVLLTCVWLITALIITLPLPKIQGMIDKSIIINNLNNLITPAPVVADKMADRFNSSQKSQYNNPQYESSVYKIINQNCGQVKVGTGFKVGKDLIATNAHVISGSSRPHVQTSKQLLGSDVVYFDSDLDFALLKTKSLDGQELQIENSFLPIKSPVVLAGYSGGGTLKIKKGIISGRYLARTDDIYGDHTVKRNIYEINTPIALGDSGGPIISNQKVFGMAFAESTNINNKGYAITSKSFSEIINLANQKNINRLIFVSKCTKS